MGFETLDEVCLPMAGSEKVIQWMGCHVYKVSGKVFAIYAPETDRVTLKCENTDVADMLIEIGVASKAPHLPRGGWVAMQGLAGDELRERLMTSRDVVIGGLSKKLRAELGVR